MNPADFVLIVLLLAVAAFCALAEMSLVATSKLRLRHLVNQKVKQAASLQVLLSQLDEVITSLVLTNNFVTTAISALGTSLCIAWLGEKMGIPIATLLMGTIIIIVGEITPKVFAIRNPERVALSVTPFMKIFILVIRPFTKIFTGASNGLLRFFGIEPAAHSPLVTEEELRLMIELGRKEGVLGEHERKLLHRIFEFGDLKVKDVMIPLEQMVTVRDSADHEEVLRVLTEEGHARIPVYRESPDRIIGIIYAQELLHIWREGWLIVLHDLIHPPFEVSADARVADLLEEFQRNRVQIAIVVDQNKKALGMVTLEDLIEEIVGEVPEKHKEGWLDRPRGA